MHIFFKPTPRVITTVTLELTLEEAEALYWAIDGQNNHAKRFLPGGVRDAMADTSEDIEEALAGVLIDNGIDFDRHVNEPESRVLSVA